MQITARLILFVSLIIIILAILFFGGQGPSISRLQKSFTSNSAAEQHLERGIEFYRERKFVDAIEAFSESIRATPSFAAYNNRALAFFYVGSLERSLEDFTQAISFQPKTASTYFNRGNVHFKLRRVKDALTDYNQALKLDPNFQQVYNNRGNTYFSIGDYKNALKDFNKVLSFKEGSIELKLDALYNRGNIFLNLQKYEAAIKDYDKVLEVNPSLHFIYANKGNAYAMMQDFEKALAAYDKAIALGKDLGRIYISRGHLYHKMNRTDDAVADFNNSLNEEETADAYMYRGMAMSRKNYIEAMNDFKKAVEIAGPDGAADIIFNRGVIRNELKHYKEAVDDFTIVIGLEPQNARAFMHRGFAKSKLNLPKEQVEKDFSDGKAIDPNAVIPEYPED